MKIIYLVHQYLPHHLGGTEVYTHGLAKRAQEAGHEVLVVTTHVNVPVGLSTDEFGTQNTMHESIRVIRLHFDSYSQETSREEYENPKLRRAFEAQLHAFAPDVVHVMHAMKLSASVLEACHDAGIPMVVTLCDFWFLCPLYTLLKPNGELCDGPDSLIKCLSCARQTGNFSRIPRHPLQIMPFARDVRAVAQRKTFLQNTLLKARRIVALTPFAKAIFIKNGYPADRIEVIPHGLELDGLYDGLDQKEIFRADRTQPIRIGFIGTLAPHKGAHILLEALAHIPDTRLECLIYGSFDGDPEYLERLKSLVNNDNRVRFMNQFEPEAMGRVLGSFDVLALPAQWYENDPLVAKAALHIGMPVISSRIGSLSEMIVEGRNGWLVEPDAPELWAKAIVEIVDRPLPSFAPTPIKSMDKNADEMLELYGEMYDENPSRPSRRQTHH